MAATNIQLSVDELRRLLLRTAERAAVYGKTNPGPEFRRASGLPQIDAIREIADAELAEQIGLTKSSPQVVAIPAELVFDRGYSRKSRPD